MIEKKTPEPAPGRRNHSAMRRVGYAASAIAGFALALVLLWNPLRLPFLEPIARTLTERGPASEEMAEPEGRGLWTCGMHPQVIQDAPGTCPICQMKLVPLRHEKTTPSSAPSAGPSEERRIVFYRNPMDPTVTSPVPMKDSMGMDYVPVYSDEVESMSAGGPSVTIDPAIVQRMGVVTQLVARRDVSLKIRTVGYLAYDQEKMVNITTKYAGFVEKVYVNYIGQPVRRGDPLFEIYSPELVQTEQELLSALEFARRMEDAPEDAHQRAEALVEAAKIRLSYWDIDPDQIERLEATGKVFRTLKVTAPSHGLVMKRMAGLEGAAVRPGMEIMHIADMSSLWLNVELFEDQLPWLQIGSTAKITLTYFPGQEFSGRIRFIEPAVSETTRTVKLTLKVANPDGRLRAGMYATVEFEPSIARSAIAVPSQSILRTGPRNLVIVALGGGRFAPREVTLGPEGDGWVQVLSGLEEGEEVVTSSQFLIDSESNLREAVQKMVAGQADREQ